jgi:hypothetical protein
MGTGTRSEKNGSEREENRSGTSTCEKPLGSLNEGVGHRVVAAILSLRPKDTNGNLFANKRRRDGLLQAAAGLVEFCLVKSGPHHNKLSYQSDPGRFFRKIYV